MTRLIDADALKGRINTAFFSEIGKIIDDAPTIDAVEVVRCKDCTHTFGIDRYTGCWWCTVHRGFMEDDYFCADGHREDGEA